MESQRAGIFRFGVYHHRALYFYQRALKRYGIHFILHSDSDRSFRFDDLVGRWRKRQLERYVTWEVALYARLLRALGRMGVAAASRLDAFDSFIDSMDGLARLILLSN